MLLTLIWMNLFVGTVAAQSNFVIIDVSQKDASIFIGDSLVGKGYFEGKLQVGKAYTFRVQCDLYHPYTDKIIVGASEPVEKHVNLLPAYGFLEVHSTPEEGATVYINNVEVGKTPYKSDKMPSGNYKVRVYKKNYTSEEVSVKIADANITQTIVKMSANFVNVTVAADKDTHIYVDDSYRGTGKWTGILSEGRHYILAKKDKHRDYSKFVDLMIGKDEYIEIKELEPIYGFLELVTIPTKAEILLNDSVVGTTPRIFSNLLIGEYSLRLQKEGFATIIKSIDIKDGETLELKETLVPGKEIHITTGSDGDTLFVDGIYAGVSPLDLSVSYGKHDFSSLRGIQTATKTFVVDKTQAKQECTLVFGKLTTIRSDMDGDVILVDGTKVGSTPMTVDLQPGNREVEVRRGELYETKSLLIDDNSLAEYYFVPGKEPLRRYLGRGVEFLTLDGAFSVSQTSVGLTYGRVKRIGWYASMMTNFGFRFNSHEWNEWLHEEPTSTFSGKSSKARFSLNGGAVVKLFGPLYLKAGVGYGIRVKSWEVGDGWYKEPSDSYRGLEIIPGLMFNFRGYTITTDVIFNLDEDHGVTEIKIGIGFNRN